MVAHHNGVVGVGSSNLLAPTNENKGLQETVSPFSLSEILRHAYVTLFGVGVVWWMIQNTPGHKKPGAMAGFVELVLNEFQLDWIDNTLLPIKTSNNRLRTH